MTKRIQTLAVMATLAAVALSACGDDDSASSTQASSLTLATTTTTPGGSTTAPTVPPTGESTVPTTPPSLANRPKVGEVVGIVPAGGRADDELVAPGTPLLRFALLAADTAGTVDFKLNQKIKRCQARPGSSVRVVPADGVLLEFVEGMVWCGTSADGGLATFLAGGQAFQASDPTFAVTVQEDGGLEVRVVQGFVQIVDGPTLGEGQRGNRTDSGWSVGPFSLSELPRAGNNSEGEVAANLLGDVLADLPPVRYPRPPAGAIGFDDTGTLRVLVTGDDGAVLDFASQFFGGLVSQQWDVPVSVDPAGADEAAAALKSGEADVVVSPSAQGGVPLLEDGNGQVWWAVTGADGEGLQEAIQGTVKASLEGDCEADGSGQAARSAPGPTCYAQIYGGSIGVEPVPLSPFAGLLGLRG